MISNVLYYLLSIFATINHILIFKILSKSNLKLNPINFVALLLCALGSFFLKSFTLLNAIYSFLFLFFLDCLFFEGVNARKFYFCFIVWILSMVFEIFGFRFIKFVDINLVSSVYLEYGVVLFLEILSNLIFRISIFSVLCDRFYKFVCGYSYFLFSVFVIFMAYFGILCVNDGIISTNIDTNIILLFFAIITILLIIKVHYLHFNQKTLINNFSYNIDYYIKLSADNRIFKHNLKNKIVALSSIKKGNSEIISELLSDVCGIRVSKADLDSLPAGINGFIQNKLCKLSDDTIVSVKNSLSSDLLSAISVKRYNNLCTMLGVVLDNAIESISLAEDKLLDIILYEDSSKIYITVSNSFNGYLDVSKVGKINYSTKGLDRGLGLFSLLTCPYVFAKVSVINNIFKVDISVSKNNL